MSGRPQPSSNRLRPRFAELAATLAGVTIGLGGCLTSISPAELVRAGPALDPVAFFSDRSTSWGVLESRAGAPVKTFRVDTQGDRGADGSVTIAQTIHWSDDKVDRRSWTLRRDANGGLAAQLSDATGPVAISVDGPMLHLSYPMKTPAGGRMEQRLYLQPDGRVLLNEGEVRVLGAIVARISEVITHEGRAPAS